MDEEKQPGEITCSGGLVIRLSMADIQKALQGNLESRDGEAAE